MKLIDAALAKLGIQTFAGASHDDPWPDHELNDRFGHLFEKAHGCTVVLVDGMSKHYVVRDMHDVRSAHTAGFHGISEALIVPNALFDELKGKGEIKIIEPATAGG